MKKTTKKKRKIDDILFEMGEHSENISYHEHMIDELSEELVGRRLTIDQKDEIRSNFEWYVLDKLGIDF